LQQIINDMKRATCVFRGNVGTVILTRCIAPVTNRISSRPCNLEIAFNRWDRSTVTFRCPTPKSYDYLARLIHSPISVMRSILLEAFHILYIHRVSKKTVPVLFFE